MLGRDRSVTQSLDRFTRALVPGSGVDHRPGARQAGAEDWHGPALEGKIQARNLLCRPAFRRLPVANFSNSPDSKQDLAYSKQIIIKMRNFGLERAWPSLLCKWRGLHLHTSLCRVLKSWVRLSKEWHLSSTHSCITGKDDPLLACRSW